MRTSYARRPPAGELARRLPRDPQGGPLHGVPARRVQRDDGLARRRATAWSRSGTACRSSRRCGRARRTVTWLHHVHAEMWQMTLPPRLAAFGKLRRVALAPPLYRRTPDRDAVGVVASASSSTSSSSRPIAITVVPPGVDPRSLPGGAKSPTPARRRGRPAGAGEAVRPPDRGAGRGASARIPELEAVIVGEGYDREELETQVREVGAERWIRAAGLRRRGRADRPVPAGVGRSRARRRHEGWGMTITEAAACGTPAVATRIAGHEDAVVDERHRAARRRRATSSRRALDRVLADDDAARRRLGARRSSTRAAFTWGPRRAARSRCSRPRRCGADARRDRDGQPSASRRRDGRAPRDAAGRGRGAALGYRGARARSPTSRCCSRRPGKVAADTKQYLYLDPSRLLERAPSMWDPNIGLGHGHPPEHRLPVPDGPVLLGARPVGRARLGRAAAVARLDPVLRRRSACCTCCARCDCAGPASSSPRSRTCSRRTRSTTRRASR